MLFLKHLQFDPDENLSNFNEALSEWAAFKTSSLVFKIRRPKLPLR